MIHLVRLHSELPKPAEPFLRLPLERLKNSLIEVLDAFADCVETKSTLRTCQLWTCALREMDEASQEIHDQKILISYPVNVLFFVRRWIHSLSLPLLPGPLQMRVLANKLRTVSSRQTENPSLLG